MISKTTYIINPSNFNTSVEAPRRRRTPRL